MESIRTRFSNLLTYDGLCKSLSLPAIAVLCVFFGHIGSLAVHHFAKFMSYTGYESFIIVGLLAIIGLEYRSRGNRGALSVLRYALAVFLSTHLMKLTIGYWLPRPSGSHGGFPSGHTAGAVALAIILSERFPKLSILWYGIAIAVAWSRVEVDDHYTYQVLAGALLGYAGAIYYLNAKKAAQQQAAEPLLFEDAV